MKDYDELIRKLMEQARKSEAYHKEWVTLEMEATGCGRDEAEKRFTITQMGPKNENTPEDA